MFRTLAILGAIAIVPSVALAQQPPNNPTPPDTGTQTTTSNGQLAAPSAQNMGLTSDQVKQLQSAISSAGCTSVQVTGTIDQQTKDGVACVRQKKNLQGKSFNDVLAALNLPFTSPDSSASKADSSQMQQQPPHDTSMAKPDTSKTGHFRN